MGAVSAGPTFLRARRWVPLTWWVLTWVASAPALADGPMPMLSAGHPVQWWFAFKLNSGKFAGCLPRPERACPFGGEVQDYSNYSQRYVFAAGEGDPGGKTAPLQEGQGCLGDTADDPLGATFAEIYKGDLHYVVWNDQFYQDPKIASCSGNSCSKPWGHSKGVLAWDDSGQGIVLQVSTPSWPASGNSSHPRSNDGNTLGCVINNNLKFSQHFFALGLTHEDLVAVLQAMRNSSVVTDPSNEQIVSNGGPEDVQSLVKSLGKKSDSKTATIRELSSHVRIISKPSLLHVPPWQLVSSLLGGVPLKAATWWNSSDIPTTNAHTHMGCWDSGLAAPAAVEIATSGVWDSTPMKLTAGPSPDGNHAKIGVSTDSDTHLAIFGDLNQEGAISGNTKECGTAQNGRGGMFFVVEDAELSKDVGALIKETPAASP
jgi:Deoxyribonuclease II